MTLSHAGRRKLLLAAVLAALAPSASAAPSGAGVSASAAGIKLEICRLPGSHAEYSGAAIIVPAGAVFTTDAFDDNLAANDNLPGAPRLKVATTAPVSLGPDKFCVDAPIRPLGTPGAGALHAALGRMFVATGAGLQQIDAGTLDGVYGLLRQTGR